MKRLLTLTTSLLLAGTFLAACGGDGGNDDTEASSNTTVTAANSNVDASGNITLTASNFRFNPSTMHATSGKITIELVNAEDDTEHNLTIEDLDVDQNVKAGGTETITIDDATSGVHAYRCDIHPSTMLGTLTVS